MDCKSIYCSYDFKGNQVKDAKFWIVPSTPTGLTAADEGKHWYNSTYKTYNFWDGSEVVVLPAVFDTGCMQCEAGEDLLSFNVVMVKNGQLFKFDPTDTDNYNRAVGITKTSALTGEMVSYKYHGKMTIAGSFADGKQLFSNASGILTDTPPAPATIYHEIAEAMGGSEIHVRLNQPIQLLP